MHFVRTGVFPAYYGRNLSQLFTERLTGDYDDMFTHDKASVEELYPKAIEIVAGIKDKVQQWLAENDRP